MQKLKLQFEPFSLSTHLEAHELCHGGHQRREGFRKTNYMTNEYHSFQNYFPWTYTGSVLKRGLVFKSMLLFNILILLVTLKLTFIIQHALSVLKLGRVKFGQPSGSPVASLTSSTEQRAAGNSGREQERNGFFIFCSLLPIPEYFGAFKPQV